MSNEQNVSIVPTVAQIAQMTSDDLIKTFGNGRKSTTIRYLSTVGFSRSQIAKMLNIRYQHVRNTLTEPMKKVD
jgi:3-methyladenine DNA glycosylase/8-oxoguanine DNA glycosylase